MSSKEFGLRGIGGLLIYSRMRAIAPRIDGAEEVTIAEDQEEYMPITIARRMSEQYPGAVEHITRWTFSPEERGRIAAGEDVFVGQLSFTGQMTPLWVHLR